MAVGTSGAKTEKHFQFSGTAFRKALWSLPAFMLVVVAGIAANHDASAQDNFPGTTGTAVVELSSETSVSIPQTITYTITAENIGSGQLSSPVVFSTLTLGGAVRPLTSGPTYVSGDSDGNGKIGENETWIYTASYAVTQADLNASGSFSNVVNFASSETRPVISAPAVTTVLRNPSLSIAKNYAFRIDGGSPGVADAGDVIAYTYAVTNDGNVSVSAISINDVHSGAGPLLPPTNETLTLDASPHSDSTDATRNDASWSVLAPGDTVTFSAEYTVTQTDVDNQ